MLEKSHDGKLFNGSVSQKDAQLKKALTKII